MWSPYSLYMYLLRLCKQKDIHSLAPFTEIDVYGIRETRKEREGLEACSTLPKAWQNSIIEWTDEDEFEVVYIIEVSMEEEDVLRGEAEDSRATLSNDEL